jgi:hypothetical protein
VRAAKQANNIDPKTGAVNRSKFRIDFLLKTPTAEGAAGQYTRTNLNARLQQSFVDFAGGQRVTCVIRVQISISVFPGSL